MFDFTGNAPGARMRRDVALYLAHVEGQESLSAIGRRAGCAPSTVLRAVRRVEDRRDDPLIDQFLIQLGRGPDATGSTAANAPANLSTHEKEFRVTSLSSVAMSKPEYDRESRKVLRRLEEPGAFLMAADGVEKAGVFSPSNKFAKPILMASRALAAAMLSDDLIARSHRKGAAARYEITDAGRAHLARLTGRARARAAAQDGPSAFAHQHQIDGERTFADDETGAPVTRRVNLGETPLGWLARRKGPDGARFLTAAEVEAGERLRDEFERAQIGPRVAQDWSRFLAPADSAPGARSPALGPADARDRFAKALHALGPGLADVALRACCFLEGLESTERRMGWSARSGKVVLKIALQRLVEYYGLETQERAVFERKAA